MYQSCTIQGNFTDISWYTWYTTTEPLCLPFAYTPTQHLCLPFDNICRMNNIFLYPAYVEGEGFLVTDLPACWGWIMGLACHMPDLDSYEFILDVSHVHT